MNDKQFEGKWDQLKGRIQTEFGKLTDDDMHQIKGNRKRLLGKLEERYGDAKQTLEKKLNSVLETANDALS